MKYLSRLAVNLMLTRFIEESGKKQILLQKRKNTGYMDGMYDFAASGHIEPGESYEEGVIREADEELGIAVVATDLEFKHLNHYYETDHVQVVFECNRYIGEPYVKEPEECEELIWADIYSLPENTIPWVRNVIKDIKMGILYDDGKFTVQTRLTTNKK